MPFTLSEYADYRARRLQYQSAMQKQKAGFPLSDLEAELLASTTPEKLGITLCGCGCGVPLDEPRVDGLRQTLNGVEVNDDCYFDALSDSAEGGRARPVP